MSNPKKGKVYPSNLINKLNLILDEFGIISSAGQLDKTINFDYTILNLILLD